MLLRTKFTYGSAGCGASWRTIRGGLCDRHIWTLSCC